MNECFEDQIVFTKDVLSFIYGVDMDNDRDNKIIIDMIRIYVLSMHKELSEVLDCADWKLHRGQKNNIDFAHLYEELVDVQKFLWGLMYLSGMTKDMFINEYSKKTVIVKERWEQFKAENNESLV